LNENLYIDTKPFLSIFMQDLKLIYDFTEQSPRFSIIMLPLLFIAIGLAIFFFSKIKVDKAATSSFAINKRQYGKFFGLVFASFAALISAFVIPSQIAEYRNTKTIFTTKNYKIVEGKVKNYHPMPASGHDTERFIVDSVQFEFSDYDLTDYGYNNAASKGGVIKDGIYVRIGFFNNGKRNVILKLETE
jgi:hypothetical protein